MTETPLSVVIASVNGFPHLESCLNALRSLAPQAEVILADSTDEATRHRVRVQWPEVTLQSFEQQMTVPELRATGISAAHGANVAVIEDHCVILEGWFDAVLAAHGAGHDVVGGSIRNAATTRLRDWAAFFCEYSEFMAPVPRGTVPSLVGMNVSYSERAVTAMADLLAEGRWETWLHPHLQRLGIELYSEPAMVIDHVKDFGFREFASQRFHYSRSHAGMRNPELGRKRLVYFLGSPALVPLIVFRIGRNVFKKKTHRIKFVQTLPLMLVYATVWSFGEALGYALGGGRSLLKVK